MADMMSKKQRSRNMKAIKSVSQLEQIVSSELWKCGIRFRRNTESLFGRPDISIKKYRVVIFIDSCFWHQCPVHGNMPKTNIDYWHAKLKRNVERDQEVNLHYENNNWFIKRVWEHEIKNNFSETINELITFIQKAKRVEENETD